MAAVSGYECEFVELVSTDIQTDCSICLSILRQPYMVQCCGNHFCRSCLKKIQFDSATDIPCPLCKQLITSTMHNKQLERVLNEKIVYCSNKERGCTWTGELGKLESVHLDGNPPHFMDKCLYVQVMCPQCQKIKLERRAITSHMQKECPRRMAVCTYCETHRGVYEDICIVHHPVCPRVPVPCPKGCGAKPFRKNLERHVIYSCPKNPQPCPFQIVGCTKKLIGLGEMERHLSDSVVMKSHFSSMERTVIALKKKNDEKSMRIKALEDDLNDKDGQVGCLLMLTKHQDDEISRLQQVIRTKSHELEQLKLASSQRSHERSSGADRMNQKQHNLKPPVERTSEHGRATNSKEVKTRADIDGSSEQSINDKTGVKEAALGVAVTALGVGISIAALLKR